MADQSNNKHAKEVRETEAWFKDLVEQAHDLVQCVDSEGRFIYVNQAWLATLKYSPEEIANITLWAIIHPDSMEHCMAVFKHVLTGKAYGEVEAIFVAKDGTPVMVEGNVNVKLDENGRFLHTRGIFRDVTERRQIEEALKQSEEQYRSLTENIPIGIYRNTPGPDGRFLMANPGFMHMFGIKSKEDLAQLKVTDLYQEPVERAKFSEKLIAEGQFKGVELRLKRMDGTPIWGSITARVVCNEHGEAAWFDCTLEDITERKQTVESLRLSEEKYRGIFYESVVAIYLFDIKKRFIDANQAGLDLLGYSREELLQMSIPDVDADPIVVLPAHQDLLSGGRLIGYEHRLKRKDGTIITVLNNSRPLTEAGGKVVGMLSTLIDITERKLAEEALKESEMRSRALVGAIPDLLFRYNREGVYLDAIVKDETLLYPQARKLVRQNTLVGKTISEVLPAPIAEKLIAGIKRTLNRGKIQILDYSYPINSKNMFFEARLAPIGDTEVVSIVRDVTERKHAEEALSESLAFEKMVATISSTFINLTPDELDKGIEEALKLIGLFFKADRSYVYEFSEDGKIYNNTHNWCAPGIRAYFEKDQNGPVNPESCWEGELLKGNTVIINDVEAMPPEQEVEKLDFQLEEIKSLFTIPLVWDGKVFGCFGLDHVVEKHRWTNTQTVLLQVVAELIANALARHRNEETIRRLSFHDQLTGLYNRHFLEEEMQRFDTERQLPISIIMADLNGLKLINDTYGHQTGDELLKKAAEVLKNACRDDDLLARFGGDEFVLYLPQTPETEAQKISGRIEEACCKEKVNDVPLSLSIGVAVKTSSEQKLSAVLKAAEDNMYQEKLTESRSGKSTIVKTLLQTLAAKSFETETHTRNMQEAAQSIGEKLGLPNSEMRRLNLLITLHDIGKINVPEELLNKKEALTGPEWEIMKKHCETGFRIARSTDDFAHVADDILTHHERWDGSGYPQGLKGEAIPLLARITAIADAYEVMSHGRPYKKAMSRSEIVAEFKKCSGTQFDPKLVEIFLSILEGHR